MKGIPDAFDCSIKVKNTLLPFSEKKEGYMGGQAMNYLSFPKPKKRTHPSLKAQGARLCFVLNCF